MTTLMRIESLDEARAATADLPDPWEAREEWLGEIGWQRPHGAYCSCAGCDPFAYDDAFYVTFDGESIVYGFRAVAAAIAAGQCEWSEDAGLPVCRLGSFTSSEESDQPEEGSWRITGLRYELAGVV